MARRQLEPFLWALFSAGGVVAALFIPVHLFLWGVAVPVTGITPPSYAAALAAAQHPAARLYLLAICSLPLFHWAHRFRYTLYDGLQVKHLNEIINTFCYGGAIAGTAAAVYLLWRI
ncbi:MAG TPA: fumarate reductase subunit FrdD [Candidatus Acidoferrales bacterium]|nr:fumarate reductase subunit FrdD [Candidatus Acidoferrales bacterium]